MKIHRRLLEPLCSRKGAYVRDLLLDLTVYLGSIDVAQLDALVAWYRGFCPRERQSQYIIEENTIWDSIARPVLLTNLGRAAAQAGQRWPFLAPVRQRIDDGRRYYLQLWDGAPTASWSLCIRAMHRQDTGLHGFVRLMLPVDADVELLHRAALDWSDMLDITSGHGGLSFTYDPWSIDAAFDSIYALARRFWGVDIEHLNGTLPLMKDHIKGVGWLTVVGKPLRERPDLDEGLSAFALRGNVRFDPRSQATVIRIGDEPVVADQNRPDGSLDAYEALAQALAPVFLEEHPDFPGDAFEQNANTLAWVRRFLEPAHWR